MRNNLTNLQRFIFILITVLMWTFILFSGSPVTAGESDAYYDFAVFDYEAGKYEIAEENLRKALESDPENPFYNYYMGKIFLKTGEEDKNKYQDAMKYFDKAYQTDPYIPGLKYDIAFLNYKLAEYSTAARFFKDVAKENPSDVLAQYYAGICLYKEKQYKEAADYFIRAGEKSPTIRANGYYYSGICFQQIGNNEKALELFEYVKQNADSPFLAENAQKWVESIKRQTGTLHPYLFYLKISRRYDDNVRLLEDDTPLNVGDYVTIGYLSGRYDFINNDIFKIGAGYSHYQSWHDDLGAYDMTASIFNIYSQFHLSSFTLGFRYQPAYFWVDDSSYLRRHLLMPEISWKINKDIETRFSYKYYNDDYLNETEMRADVNGVFLDVYYTILEKKGLVFGGISYLNKSASRSDESYDSVEAELGMTFRLPWEFNLSLTGKYYDKTYDHIDRNDDRYSGSVSVSRKLFYDWLSVIAEFDYTRNNSNIKTEDYERAETTLSLTAKF